MERDTHRDTQIEAEIHTNTWMLLFITTLKGEG